MMGCWVTCRFQKTISYENQSATELSKRGKKTAKKLPKIPLTMVWSGGKNKPSFRENQSANPIEVGQADKWYAAGKGVHQTFYWPSLDQLQSTPWGGGIAKPWAEAGLQTFNYHKHNKSVFFSTQPKRPGEWKRTSPLPRSQLDQRSDPGKQGGQVRP